MSMDSEFFDKIGQSAHDSPSPRLRLSAVTTPNDVSGETDGEEKERSGFVEGMRRWATNGDDRYWGGSPTCNTVPAGLYYCASFNSTGPTLIKQKIDTDSLLILPDNESERIIADFDLFWARKEEFDKRGFLHKRGELLWGPPGGGKTSTIQILNQKIIKEQDGAVVYIDDPNVARLCLQMLRRIEPDRRLICILEDIDALTTRYGESEFLALLDGESQINNVFYLGTTNYPEKLDPRLVDRPSRFDRIRYIGMPSAAARRMYLRTKEPDMQEDELEAWVEKTEGFAVAHLREVIISVKAMGKSLEGTINRMKRMQKSRPSSESDPSKTKVGFGMNRNESDDYGD